MHLDTDRSGTDLPVVYIPGSLCDARVFTAQLLGVQAPATVANIYSDDSIEAMAQRVLADAPETFCVVGLSLGGIVAAEVAAIAPERVKGVALLDTNLDAPNDQQIRTRTRWASDTRAGHFIDVVTELISEMTAWPAVTGPEILAMARDLGPAVFLSQNRALLHRTDRRQLVSLFDCPTLIACGEGDRVCSPGVHAELASYNPRAKLVMIENAGHLSTIDQPEALNRVLNDWIEQANTQFHRGEFHGIQTN